MKKIVVAIAALGLSYAGFAQDKYVTSALTALNQKHLDEAKADIDRAIANPETKEKPKALLAKGKIYLALTQSLLAQGEKTPEADKVKGMGYAREATQTLMKLVEVKADYEKDEVNMYLFFGAVMYYNDGINAYDEKKYSDAVDYLKNSIKIHDLGGGKRFEKFMLKGKLDTIAINAQVQIARCAYAQNNFEEVIKQLNVVKANPAGKTKDNYIILLESYEKYNAANQNKMAAEELAATAEARAAFPDDPNIKNMEMNTLMKSGKTGELQKKMEDEAAKTPDNADLQYNLGILYSNMAAAGKDGKKPANAAEMMAKAEAALGRAVKLAPDNGGYNNSMGTIYYQQGYDYNDQMNAITGTSAADNKKYEDLKTKRDAAFNKAIPFYEKAVSIFAGRAKVEGNDLDVYHSTLVGLKQIYIVLGKTDKMKEVGDKIKALDGQ